jgi:Bacterial Ig-like domain (group 1)/IPT/TIG domain
MLRPKRTRASAILVIALLSQGMFTIAAVAPAQELTSWSTQGELMQWVRNEDGEIAVEGVEQLWDGSRSYIRVNWRKLETANAYFELRSHATAENAEAAVIDTQKYNAVRATIRGHGFDALVASWVDIHYDGESTPYFSLPQSLTQSSAWRDVLFRFSDSPLYHGEPIAYFGLMPFLGSEGHLLTKAALPRLGVRPNEIIGEDAYLDVAKIALVRVSESLPNPVITDLEPKVVRHGGEITIKGRGFDNLAPWNIVQVDDTPVPIIAGDNHRLRVRLQGAEGSSDPAPCEKCSIVVLTRGGKKATAPQNFQLLGEPFEIRLVGPEEQVATMSADRGATLTIDVRVIDLFHRPLSGEKVTFQASSGGVLSVTETITDKNGIARTSLSVQGEPYPGAGVHVNANASGSAWGMLTVKLK